VCLARAVIAAGEEGEHTEESSPARENKRENAEEEEEEKVGNGNCERWSLAGSHAFLSVTEEMLRRKSGVTNRSQYLESVD